MERKGSTVIPCLHYRNAAQAINWLCDVIGFEPQLVVPGENNTIAHAQLCLGPGMIMLGSVTENEYGRLMCHPDEIGGRQTQSAYIVVDDADAVHARVVQAQGWRIAIDIKDEDYGGRGFSCYDPEGVLWNVGTYDPWRDGGA